MENGNFLRGTQLYQVSRFSDAIVSFEKALQEEPNSLDAKYFLALCHFQLDNNEKAKEMCFALLSQNPDNEYVHYLIAKIYNTLDEEKNALKHIDLAIQINPFEADFMGEKSILLFNQKKYEEALKYVDQGLSVDPNSSICLNIKAQILTKLNRKEEASFSTLHLLEKDPEDVYSHSNVGWIELENGNHKKAFEHFREALRLNPNFSYAREGMTTALKAKNFLYRWYLSYSFWMRKKSSQQQWTILIVIYIAYRASIKVISATGMSYLIVPFIIAYLFFALGTWIMEPMSNAILLNNKYGKYLLSDDAKRSGTAFSLLILTSILCFITYQALGIDYFSTLALASLCAVLPLSRYFIYYGKNSKFVNLGIGSLILIVGSIGPLFTNDLSSLNLGILFSLIAYTWIDNLVK